MLEAKFPRRAGHIVKITCTGMYPTNCHSEESEFGNNIVCTQRNKYGPRLKKGQPCQLWSRFGNNLFD